jgi:hypothetical protein
MPYRRESLQSASRIVRFSASTLVRGRIDLSGNPRFHQRFAQQSSDSNSISTSAHEVPIPRACFVLPARAVLPARHGHRVRKTR